MNLHKRSQMEIIGLVVIIILISLGMLFMAKFALDSDSKKKVFTRKGLAYSTMSAIMKTTIEEQDCSTGYTQWVQPQIGKDLLEDCAKNEVYAENNGYSLYKCSGMHSCLFLEQTIFQLLNSTLGTWNKNYEFKSHLIRVYEDEPLELLRIKEGKGCNKLSDRDTSSPFPIHTDAGLIESELYICD